MMSRLVALAFAILAVVIWAVFARAQTPVAIEYPSVVNPTTGATSYATSIAPIATGVAAGSLVLKASPGAVYQVTASNPAAAAWLVLVNATAAPTGGATITPLACVAVPAAGSATINYSPGPPANFNIGIVAGLLTTASSCFTFTTTTGYISGVVQ
jgi:hypothetical protein